MNSNQLQSYINKAGQVAYVIPSDISFVKESMACYLGILVQLVDAQSVPRLDLMSISTSILLLSNATNMMETSEARDAIDYLVGMGCEQSGELYSRLVISPEYFSVKPEENDHWYRLSLSLLHYLAGGFRVQGLSVIERLKEISRGAKGNYPEEYRQAYSALRRLYSGRMVPNPISEWEKLLFGADLPTELQKKRIFSLSKRIQNRRQATLSELGEANEAEWLREHGIVDVNAIDFWRRYLTNLDSRGINSFTDEQIGPTPGFNNWLIPNKDLLAILPTGAGKTIIGELRTALALALGKQVIWILPTRSLVRQIKRELTVSFHNMGVSIYELPTTEDFHPIFLNGLNTQRCIAVSTPEKLEALIRARKEAIKDVGLVVLDEAQNLFTEARGVVFETVIHELNTYVPNCDFVLMSAVSSSAMRLRNFIRRLKPDTPLAELISENRPTRRINGALTVSENNHPVALFYPPGLESEEGRTANPYIVEFQTINIQNDSSGLDISLEILKPLTKSVLRTVLFVEKITSTVKQARSIANALRENHVALPPEDIDRLSIELGRDSVVSTYGEKGVSPHHAGLLPLEQHIIEKWIRSGLLQTVVATPTLAQGVNLPFDISIVSYVQRYNPRTRQREDISYSEIINMLGRAGRAGYVSDGISLVTAPSDNATAIETLDQQRRYFFHRQEDERQYLGLSQLMLKTINAPVNDPTWLLELSNLNFSEVQSLLTFSLRAALRADDLQESISNLLREFPSIQDMTEYFGEGVDVLSILARTLEPLIINLHRECSDEVELLDAIMRTGMPVQIIKSFFRVLRQNYDLLERDQAYIIDWSDQVVSDALTECNQRAWFRKLFSEIKVDLPTILTIINLWRSGAPIVEIEQYWNHGRGVGSKQIAIGKYFNHTNRMIAQFWGALSICEEIVFPELIRRPLENIQTYVRDGVSSVTQLAWLNKLGGVDRVLSKRLAEFTPLGMNEDDLDAYIDQQLGHWRQNRNSIPKEIGHPQLGALISVLKD